MIKQFFIVTLLLTLVSQSSLAGCGMATLYYVPFSIEEYVPGGFTDTNIKSKAAEKWAITNPVRIKKLLKILRTGRAHAYDDGLTRALLDCGKDQFFINKDGQVRADGISIKIDLKAFLMFHDGLLPEERVAMD